MGIGKSNSKQVAYWTVAGGFDAMFSLWNPTNQAQDLVVIFYYGDGSGSYKLPVHLAGNASTTIDMALLIASQQPDASGQTFPMTETAGSAIIGSSAVGKTPVNLVVAGGTFNVETATCDPTCITCCGYANFQISPSNFSVPVGQAVQCYLQGTDCNGGTSTFSGNWNSSDTTVMTVDTTGLVTGVAAGNATIAATVTPSTEVTQGPICGSPPPPCPRGTPGASTPGTVRVADHLQVISDVSGPLLSCSNIIGRLIRMKVVDINNNTVGLVPIKENFLTVSQNTCGNGQPRPSACQNTDNANSEFTDNITVNCNPVGGPCGYDITYQWQWCPGSRPSVNIGRFVETVHANAITVNGVTTPGAIPAGTNIFP